MDVFREFLNKKAYTISFVVFLIIGFILVESKETMMYIFLVFMYCNYICTSLSEQIEKLEKEVRELKDKE